MKSMWRFTAIFTVLTMVFIVQAGTSDGFRSQFSKTADAYLKIKDALVAENADLASENASEFLKTLESVDAGQLPAESQKVWQEKLTTMQDQAKQIKSSESVETQRAAFGKLSEAVGFTAEEFGPLKTTLYRQYCPMAFNNEGAQWLSSSEKIQNPYLGPKMSMCGKVVETLKSTE